MVKEKKKQKEAAQAVQSTSKGRSKKTRQQRTSGSAGKNRGCRCTYNKKVQTTNKKNKKTMTRISMKTASGKTTPRTGNTTTETEPDHSVESYGVEPDLSSVESSGVFSSELEKK